MPYSLLSKDALKECEIAEVVTGKKGQKYAEIRTQPSVFQLSADPQHCPFQVSVFQDDGTATRLNLELNIDEATQGVLNILDTYFEEKLKELAPGKAYHKLVQKTGDWPPRLRIKVNTKGPGAARFWSDEATPLGNARQVETCGRTITACVCFPKLWLMGLSAGVTCELRAAVIHECNIPTDEFPL